MEHVSVLLGHTLDILAPVPGQVALDCTLGLGGHSSSIAKNIGSDGLLIGLDADQDNLTVAEERLKDVPCALQLIHSNFRSLAGLDLPPCDMILADLGLSSPHLDDSNRGFSFREDAPLDMRFDRSVGETAAVMLERLSQEEIADILFRYGELRESRKIATIIKEGVPQTTAELVTVAEKSYGWRAKKYLAQIFQALRIAVNDELGALESLLQAAPTLLKPGGRLAIITFHSLEDRAVKQVFKALTTAPIDEVTGQDLEPAPFTMLTKKPITPSDDEVDRNPRARSAKLRAIKKR